MQSLAEMIAIALRKKGKLCSGHKDLLRPEVHFRWARLCKRDEEAKMVDCPLESAAVPGKPYGLLFEGISHYKSYNQDNLQVGYLADVKISGAPHPDHCVVRFASSPGDEGGEVMFEYTSWSVLVAPERT